MLQLLAEEENLTNYQQCEETFSTVDHDGPVTGVCKICVHGADSTDGSTDDISFLTVRNKSPRRIANKQYW